MPIPVTCQCGARFAAKDELAGKAVKCPKCSQPLRIPAADKTSPVAKTEQPGAAKSTSTKTATSTAVAKPTAPKASATKAPEGPLDSLWDEIGLTGSKTGVTCPNCKADMQPGAVICVACGFNTQTGKQLTTRADSDAKKRREEIERQQRLAAERAGKANMAKSTGGPKVASSGYSGDGYLGDNMSVWQTTTQIVLNPVPTFSNMPTQGGTGSAIGYAYRAAATVAGIVIGLFVGFLVLRIVIEISAAGQLPPPEALGIVVGTICVIALFILAYIMFFATTLLFIQAPIFAGFAHLALKYIGKSELDFYATYRCVVYNYGAMFILSIIPGVNFFASIINLVLTGVAFAHHHRVSGGNAAIAMVLASLGIIALFVLLYLVGAAAMLILFLSFMPKTAQ